MHIILLQPLLSLLHHLHSAYLLSNNTFPHFPDYHHSRYCVSSNTQSDHNNNQHMCNSFIDYFKSKIVSIHNTIIGMLPTLSTPLPDRAQVGPTLDAPSPVSPEQVLAILNSIPAKSSPLDFIPTSLLKSCSGVFSLLISRLANLSFSQEVFPTKFKVAQVTPILKKPGLPSSDPANFRLISNLNNISKILERLFLSHLLPHINSSSNFNPFQSAYRPHHSNETALTLTLDNVFHAADNGSATLLVSLDQSAAFDSINHNILINRLSSCFGLTGLELDWISSYLHNRRQSVKISDTCSPLSDIISGVPHGSVLGPILFALYTSPISAIADAHNILQQQYADDTQLYISISAKTITQNTCRLESCLSDLHVWFSHNWLALNPSKSEVLLLGTSQRLKTLSTLSSVNVSGTTVPLTTQIKLLGVTLDQSLSFDSHITALSKSCFYQIRALRHIWPNLSEDTANLIASSLVSSRLDYANACLFGISVKNLSRIQRIQNTLARVVTCSRSRSSSAPLLKHLHWLPVSAPHSLQNCPTYFQVTPNHSSIISVIPHSTLCSFAPPPLFQCSASLCLTCQLRIRLTGF